MSGSPGLLEMCYTGAHIWSGLVVLAGPLDVQSWSAVQRAIVAPLGMYLAGQRAHLTQKQKILTCYTL